MWYGAVWREQSQGSACSHRACGKGRGGATLRGDGVAGSAERGAGVPALRGGRDRVRVGLQRRARRGGPLREAQRRLDVHLRARARRQHVRHLVPRLLLRPMGAPTPARLLQHAARASRERLARAPRPRWRIRRAARACRTSPAGDVDAPAWCQLSPRVRSRVPCASIQSTRDGAY
jgi:hypothetical protein